MDGEAYVIYTEREEGWLNPWASVLRVSDQRVISDTNNWEQHLIYDGEFCGIVLMDVDDEQLFLDICTECKDKFDTYEWRFLFSSGEVVLCSDCCEVSEYEEGESGIREIRRADDMEEAEWRNLPTNEELDRIAQEEEDQMAWMQEQVYGAVY